MKMRTHMYGNTYTYVWKYIHIYGKQNTHTDDTVPIGHSRKLAQDTRMKLIEIPNTYLYENAYTYVWKYIHICMEIHTHMYGNTYTYVWK
jgi:hypothetical protein